MITRWEIRENTLTSGSVYILAVVGDAGDVSFIEKELYFFCKLVDVKLPPFTHIFELTNISDDDMLEKIRVKIEECINETANNATAVFSADHLGKDLNLDVISPETQVFPMEFQSPSKPQTVIKPQRQESSPKPTPVQPKPQVQKQDIFAADPGPSLRIAEATRYQEEPPTVKTDSRLSLAKDGLSFDKETDAFEGGIQLENELDVGDGTFISLDTASAKKLQETTDFDPNAGLSGLLKGGKLEPLNTQASADPRNISSDGVSIVPHIPQTSSGGSILNKIFRKFSGSGKKGPDTEVTASAPHVPMAKAKEQPMKTQTKAETKTASVQDKTNSKTSITQAAAEVFKEKKPSLSHNIIVTPDEPTPDAFKKTEVRHNKSPNAKQDMQGPLAEQIFANSGDTVSGNIPVDDIFAAETICDFYSNNEEFSSTKTVDAPKKEVEAILSAKPSADGNMADDFTNVPNLLGPATKVPANVKRKEPEAETDASPLGDLLNREEPAPLKDVAAKKQEAKSAPKPAQHAAEQKEKSDETIKTSAINNIVLASAGDNGQFKITPTADTLPKHEVVNPENEHNTGQEPVYEAPTEGFFGTGNSSAETENLTETSNVADMHGFTGVLGSALPEEKKKSAPPVAPVVPAAPVATKPKTPSFKAAEPIVKKPVSPAPAMPKPQTPAFKAAEPAEPIVKKPVAAPIMPKAPQLPKPVVKEPQKPVFVPAKPIAAAAPVKRPPAPPAGLSQQMHKNMVELNKAPLSPERPALKQTRPAAPPPPPPMIKKLKTAQNISEQKTTGKQILRGSEKNMTQDDSNKIKNLAKPEPQEEEQTSPAQNGQAPARPQNIVCPPANPINLKSPVPHSLPQVTGQNIAPRAVPPQASAPRPNMPQITRAPQVNGPVHPAPIVRPAPLQARPAQAVPSAAQPTVMRPVNNVPRPAAQPAPKPQPRPVAKEDIAEKTKTIDHTIQIPIGQIYKKNNWPLEVPLVPTFTFDNMDLASNRFPHAAAMSVIENIGTMYNPFVLYGEGGSGKTHFLNAMGYELSKKVSQEKIFITNGVRFARGIQRYVEEGKKDSLDEFFKNAEVLIVDDIHLTAVNEHNREFISKLLNRFLKEKKQIIISSKYPPESLARFEDLVNFRMDQGWVSELKQPRPQHFARIYNKMVQDSEMGITEAQAQSFFGSSGYTLGEISRYIRTAKVLYRKIKDSNGPAKGYDEILSYMLAVSGEDQKSQVVIKSFEDIVSLQRGENMDWGSFGFFFPQDQADKFKWIAYATMQRAKELGIKGGFNFALKSAYSTEHIISSAFKIANICDNKNLKGAIILGPSSISCTPAIRDNFYDILTHMLEIMMIRCGIVNAEGIKLPSSYVKVLGEVLK